KRQAPGHFDKPDVQFGGKGKSEAKSETPKPDAPKGNGSKEGGPTPPPKENPNPGPIENHPNPLPILAPIPPAQAGSEAEWFGEQEGRAWCDFDGDGTLDWCRLEANGGSLGKALITLSTGSRFDDRAAGGLVSKVVDKGYANTRAWADF